ncbi:MAG TPA: hypothetical protein VIJ92_08155 [Ginsengibacter sp.]
MTNVIPRTRIKTSFLKFSSSALLTLATYILSRISNNPNFLTPSPTLAAFAEVISNFQNAMIAALTGDRQKIELRKQARVDLITVLIDLAEYVTFTAGGVPAVLESSGFEMYKQREPVYIPKPENVLVKEGLNSGELILSVQLKGKAQCYFFQYTLDPLTENSVWESIAATTKEYTLTGLEKGKMYWCRVAAVGGNNQIVYSDEYLSRIVQ